MARRARVEDVHEIAAGMPFVTVEEIGPGRPVYQVGRRSFVFFRNPRPDAVDPHTGERYDDVIVFWVGSEADKQALVQDERTPFFTTRALRRAPERAAAGQPGRRAVPAGAGRGDPGGLVSSRASRRRAADWLAANPPT